MIGLLPFVYVHTEITSQHKFNLNQRFVALLRLPNWSSITRNQGTRWDSEERNRNEKETPKVHLKHLSDIFNWSNKPFFWSLSCYPIRCSLKAVKMRCVVWIEEIPFSTELSIDQCSRRYQNSLSNFNSLIIKVDYRLAANIYSVILWLNQFSFPLRARESYQRATLCKE